jgi:hypothetical protein
MVGNQDRGADVVAAPERAFCVKTVCEGYGRGRLPRGRGYLDPYEVLPGLCTSGAGAAPRAALEC